MLTPFNEIFINSSFFWILKESFASIRWFNKMVLKRITSDWGGQIWVIVRFLNKWLLHLADISRLGNLHQEYIFHCLPWIKILLLVERMCDQLIASKMWIKIENCIVNKFRSLMKNLVMVECILSTWNSEEGKELHSVPAGAWAILFKISHIQSVQAGLQWPRDGTEVQRNSYFSPSIQ